MRTAPNNIGILVFIGVLSITAQSALAQGINIQIDEYGKGTMNGNPLPYSISPDPISGLSTLMYQLPFPVRDGDLFLTEPGVTPPLLSDLIRFGNIQNTAGFHGAIFFFSDPLDANDVGVPLADNPFGVPPPNNLGFPIRYMSEVGPEGSNGVIYTAIANQGDPGSLPGGIVTYTILSDSVPVPEPSAIGLLGAGGLSLLGFGWRRWRRRAILFSLCNRKEMCAERIVSVSFLNATAIGGVGRSLTGPAQSKGEPRMRSFLTMIMIAGVSVFLLAPAQADWNAGDPAKYVQMPDPNGMNVNATFLVDTAAPVPPGAQPVYPWQKILADDFLCTQTGPITDIHIWGSWLGDKIPFSTTNPNLQNVAFKLSLHTNVPAGVDAPYSHPGPQVWTDTYYPGTYASRFWSNSHELFYEPNTGRIIGTDSQIWQYNFDIDPAKAFIQQGTAANPQIYWLDVQAIIPEPAPLPGTTLPPDFVFGWKTSLDGFTVPDPTGQLKDDDAVFGDTLAPGGLPYGQFPDSTGTASLPWMDMHYPSGSPYAGHSINLAFAITTVPEPSTLALLGWGLVSLLWYTRRKPK